MTAAALIGFSFSGNLFLLCLCAIPLGLGAGAIDTALNNYVAMHYSATHMNFLHCFYGVGVSVSPYILSLVIGGEQGWRGGYRTAFAIQFSIALLLFLTLPIWKKAHVQKSDEKQRMKTLTIAETLHTPGVRTMCCLFITSCAIECTCGGWGSPFLVEYKHTATDYAAKIVLGAAISLLLLPLSPGISAAGLFFIELGNGPLFPNFNYLTPQNFGEDISQSVMGIQMAASYIGIMAAPAVCGILGQFISMGIFPVYLLVFYLIMIIATQKIKYVLHVRKY